MAQDSRGASGPSAYASTRHEILQAVQENSIRRGVFFLKNLLALDLEMIVQKIEHLAKSVDMELWREHAVEVGISPTALEVLDQQDPPIPYAYYFCLPDQLVQEPSLLLYYRNVAMVSNKVMSNIGLETTRYETGMPIERGMATQIAQHLNAITSSLVPQTNLLGKQRHLEMVYANLGASLDGAWRNEVGRLAYASVITPLIVHLHRSSKLHAITYRLKGRIVLDDEDETALKDQTSIIGSLSADELKRLLAYLEEQRVVYRQLEMVNGNRILLNRQLNWRGSRIGPDLITQVTEPDSAIVYSWAGELKGGADPAGSDEHWKTATQAFNRMIEAARQNEHPTPRLSLMATILVDRVAAEAELWLRQGKLASVHNLTRIANDARLQEEFWQQLTAFFEAKTIG